MLYLGLLLLFPAVFGIPVLPGVIGGPGDLWPSLPNIDLDDDAWTNPESGVIGGPDDMGPIDPDANPGHDLWPDIPYPDGPEGPLDYFTRKHLKAIPGVIGGPGDLWPSLPNLDLDDDAWTNPESGVIGGPDDMGPVDPDANPGHDLWPDIPYPDRPAGPLDYFTRKHQKAAPGIIGGPGDLWPSLPNIDLDDDAWTNPESGVIGGPDDMGPTDPDANPGHDLWPDIPYPDGPVGPLDYFTRKHKKGQVN